MAKRIRKSFQGGNLKSYNEFLDKQTEHRSTFKVISSGLTRKVVFESGVKYRFFSNSKKDLIKGSYFVNLVRKSISKYIDSGKEIPVSSMNIMKKVN